MNKIFQEARAAGLSRRLRNSIIRGQRKTGAVLVRGPCGYFDACGARFASYYTVLGTVSGGLGADQILKLGRSGKLCPLCAILTDRDVHGILDLEDSFGVLFELGQREVVGFLQGWDQDSMAGTENLMMYKIGRRLARDLVEEDA
jgi:hypothetical protein